MSLQQSITEPQKEMKADTRYNMDESWKHYGKGEKSDTKCQILYNYIKRTEQASLQEHYVDSKAGWHGEWGVTIYDCGVSESLGKSSELSQWYSSTTWQIL